MELQAVREITRSTNGINGHGNITSSSKQFIEANTLDVSLYHLRHDCIIPVFSRDNESTISHQEFIETVQECTQTVFPAERIQAPELRVSHVVKGRIPEAIGKPAKDLLDNEKTVYYERAAFILEVPSIRNVINENTLNLTIGGVRAYNNENLYGKKSMEKFKVFIGFKNMVCCNLCVSTDGFAAEIKASTIDELRTRVIALLQGYNIAQHLSEMSTFGDYEMSEHQFAQFLGKARLYNFLPKRQKQHIPLLELNDGQISTVARAYYEDEDFASAANGGINLWKMYNLFTGATKSSYIDTFVERTVNAHQLTNGFVQALDGIGEYKWFLE